MTDDEPKLWPLWLAFIAALVIIWLAITHAAWAHWKGPSDPAMHKWFDSLASGKGLCCSFADGIAIDDVDWDTATVADAAGKPQVIYRVRLNGVWIDVPPEAVVTEPNKYGKPVVWPFQDANGVTQIRCFIPGAGA